ncbi:MAG: helix-turn-helix domain-containing protein [Polyangiaceae bacterium]
MIAKEKEAEIQRLYHAEKWPIGTIATQLGVHHTTVQRVLQHAGVQAKVVAPRPSMADPFVPFIVEQLAKYPDLRASRLFEMVKERGYLGGPEHFRRIVGRHRPRKPAEAFLRLRTLPGEQAQVDWAHFGKLQVGRASRTLWAVRDGAQLFAPAVSALLPRRCHVLLSARSRRSVPVLRRRGARRALRQPQERCPGAARRRHPIPPHAAGAGRALPL